MKSIEGLLFKLRFSEFYYEDHAFENLGPLRPLVRTDARAREILMTVVLEAEYLSRPSVRSLELLLAELPDSPQVRFLLHWHAYEYRGEDSMGTHSAREIMCRLGPPEARLRREVEQAFLNNAPIYFAEWEHMGADIARDFVVKKLVQWADEGPRYIPILLAHATIHDTAAAIAIPALRRHPGFPLGDYHLGRHASEFECRVAAPHDNPSPGALIRALRADGMAKPVHYVFHQHAPVDTWSAEDFTLLEAVAANPADPLHANARLLLVRVYDVAPPARDWVRRELEADPDNDALHRNLVLSVSDHEVVWRSIQVLADRHKDFYVPMEAIRRMAWRGHKLAADRAVPMLTRAWHELPADQKPEALSVLSDYYGDHPEARRVAREAAPPPPPPLPAFRNEMERLIHAARHSPGGRVDGRPAILSLAEQFAHAPEVRALLFEQASVDNHDTFHAVAWMAVVFCYPDSPETLELLTRPTQNHTLGRFQRAAIRYLDRSRKTLEETRHHLESEDCVERVTAPGSLALWHGDEPGVFGLVAKICLRTLVARWPGEERVFVHLRAVLSNPDTELQELALAARLLSRAFSTHPETPELLRRFMRFRAAIFAEYLGLNHGSDEAMEWGLSALRGLQDDPAHEDLAKAGPMIIVWFCGPRHDLLAGLGAIQKDTINPRLRANIEGLLGLFVKT